MLVIGDAAHAASPSSGQGASMAIEDAVRLGRCVRDHPDPLDAFAAYERLRRARVERVVETGRAPAATRWRGRSRVACATLVTPWFLERVARDDGAALAWLHRHHIDWDAPVAV